MIFKQAFRFAFIALIWKQYKRFIVSTTLLLLYFFLVGKIHADFLQHIQLQEDTSQSGASFIYKWLALAIGTALYAAYHFFNKKRKKNEPLNKAAALKDKQLAIQQELSDLPPEDDPFVGIRKRKKLRSRADFLMEKENQDNSN